MSRKISRRAVGEYIENLENRWLLSVAPSIVMTPTLDIEPAVTGTTVVGYTPAQIKSAYGFSSISLGTGLTANGAGQTIAIIDAYNDPDIGSDLTKFDSTFGLANPTLKVVNEAGGAKLPATNTSWDLETSLDVEWAHAMAPGANILLVEANSSSLGDLLSAVNYARGAAGVSVVSMSWGSTEFPTETSYDSYFLTPSGHQGVTFVASSGDAGGFSGPLWPAISDNVLSVGGTTLKITSAGAYSSETSWSDSTGGISEYEPEAAYQEIAQDTGAETSPDVSYDANPSTGVAVYDSEPDGGQSGWFEVGGTSAGAPQWAALVAIADQGRTAHGVGTLNGVSGTLPTLFSLYSSSATYSADFHDVSSGNNGVWLSTAGYDAVTGLGSPRAGGIVAALVNASGASSATASVTSTTTHSASAVGRGRFGAVANNSPAPTLENAPISDSQNIAPVIRTPEAIFDQGSKVIWPAAAQLEFLAAPVQTGAGFVYLTSADDLATTAAEAIPAAAIDQSSDLAVPADATIIKAAMSPVPAGVVMSDVGQPLAMAAAAAPLAAVEDSSSATGLVALIGTAAIVGAHAVRYHRRRQVAGASHVD